MLVVSETKNTFSVYSDGKENRSIAHYNSERWAETGSDLLCAVIGRLADVGVCVFLDFRPDADATMRALEGVAVAEIGAPTGKVDDPECYVAISPSEHVILPTCREGIEAAMDLTIPLADESGVSASGYACAFYGWRQFCSSLAKMSNDEVLAACRELRSSAALVEVRCLWGEWEVTSKSLDAKSVGDAIRECLPFLNSMRNE